MPLFVGCMWYYLEVSRGTNPKVTDIFLPYKNSKVFMKIIGATVIQTIFILLWSVFFIIPGIYKAIAYSQTFYILKDHPEMGILDAIAASDEVMHGRSLKIDYVLKILGFTGWAILSLITFGFALLFVFPYFFTMLGTFYHFHFDKGKVREIKFIKS